MPSAVATVREATGANAAAIQTAVDAFRTDLGTLNANVVNSFGSGRREINWDGTPDARSAPNLLPAAFFNTTTPRGVVFSTPGTGFQVSMDNDTPPDPDPDQVEFDNLNPTYSTAFSVFSPQRLFTPLDSNTTDVHFFNPGSETPATVLGFGAVFTDVDTAGSTRLQFFDANGNLLTQRDVLATAGDGSLSFLGITFTSSAVARVRITSGAAALTSTASPNDVTQGGTSDLVVMDDFIYGEPVAVGVTVPAAQEVPVSSTRTFSAAAGNAISLALQNLTGTATPSTPVEVTLAVTNGTLSLARTTGLTFTTGDGTNDPTMTLTGTVADITAALNGLVYRPTAGFNGNDVLTLQVKDTGLTSTVNLRVSTRNADTPGVYDPASGTWFLRNTASEGTPDIGPFTYGLPGWDAVVGDWDGDGRTTIGVVDRTGASNANAAVWFLRNTSSPGTPAITPYAYGARNMIPVSGDWDGNGTFTAGVFDPANATWFLRNSNSAGAPDIAAFSFGAPGWTPIVGDWDGNGTFTVGVFDPATATFYLRNSNSAGTPDITPFAFGAPGWHPVAGDWNGDNVMTVGVVDVTGSSDPLRGLNAVWFLRNSNSGGLPDINPFPYGARTFTPVAGNWNFPDLPLHGSGVGPGAEPLSAAALQGAVADALTRFQGLDPALTSRLAAARFSIADLPGTLLGLADPTADSVVIDLNAAGYGWATDHYGLTAGRMDLRTAVVHELGHLAGLPDEDGGSGPMASVLSPGVSRV